MADKQMFNLEKEMQAERDGIVNLYSRLVNCPVHSWKLDDEDKKIILLALKQYKITKHHNQEMDSILGDYRNTGLRLERVLGILNFSNFLVALAFLWLAIENTETQNILIAIMWFMISGMTLFYSRKK